MDWQWLQLADGAWINMGNVNAVRKGSEDQLRLEFIGEQDKHPNDHRVINKTADIALIEGYLAQAAYKPSDLDMGEPGPFARPAFDRSRPPRGYNRDE